MDAPLDAAVILALGGNLGDVAATFDAALERLDAEGLHVRARSPSWRSAAWPDPSAPAFLNAVVLVDTTLDPRDCLAALHRVEAALGRRKAEANAPRTIDLDLIAHGRIVLATPDLTLPHPRAHQRGFVMGPLAQIAPGWRHPALGITAAELAASATVGVDARPV